MSLIPSKYICLIFHLKLEEITKNDAHTEWYIYSVSVTLKESK